MIDKEDFGQWLAHPVTEALMRALKAKAKEAEWKWMEISWIGGTADQSLLVDLRARAECLTDLAELTVEELNEAINDE